MDMKAKRVVFVLALVVGAIVVFLIGRTPPAPADAFGPSDADKSRASRIADARTSGAKAKSPAGKAAKPVLDLGEDADDDEDDEESKRTPEEKKLAADVEKALDEEDFELAKKCAPLAMKCKVTEIRQAMVDTLGWFGEKAIPELTPFIADPDEDVAESAMNEWESAVSSIADDAEKIGAVELAMQVITDEDDLESISSEYIGVDEKLAVESLLRVIEGGGSANGIAKAKETYEFVTGEEFTDRAAAEKWIAEEYEPPEPEEY